MANKNNRNKTTAKKKQSAKNHMNAQITNSNGELSKLLKIFCGLIICFFIAWGITYMIVEKKGKSSSGDSSASDRVAAIQYDKILVGTIMKQNRNEYYVLLDKTTNQFYALYESYLSTYSSKENALKIYTIDMEDPLNKKYYGESANIDVENLETFKVSTVTLLHIKDNEVIEFFEGNETVLQKLKELTK